jgi:hypothetical protein
MIMDANRWSSLILARRTGLSHGTVKHHLGGRRRIQGEHLAKYIQALDHPERNGFLAAWLEDLGLELREIKNGWKRQDPRDRGE